MNEKEAFERLRRIESALTRKGLIVSIDRRRRDISVLKPSEIPVADHDHLWERAHLAPTFHVSEAELASESYVEIVLRKIALHVGV